jgi:hypothetical protein
MSIALTDRSIVTACTVSALTGATMLGGSLSKGPRATAACMGGLSTCKQQLHHLSTPLYTPVCMYCTERLCTGKSRYQSPTATKRPRVGRKEGWEGSSICIVRHSHLCSDEDQKMSPSIFYSGVEPPRMLADHAAAGGQRYSSFKGPALLHLLRSVDAGGGGGQLASSGAAIGERS